MRSRGAQGIDHALRVAEIGEIRRGDKDDLIGPDERATRPAGPHVRHVEHDAGGRGAQQLDHVVERRLGEIVEPVERRRRRKQAEAVRAARQESVEKVRIESFRREDGLGDSLGRILVEIEPGGAEAEVHVDDGGLDVQIAGDRECDVVGDGGGRRHRL